jgi:Na+-driven multidrug efflux pump
MCFLSTVLACNLSVSCFHALQSMDLIIIISFTLSIILYIINAYILLCHDLEVTVDGIWIGYWID